MLVQFQQELAARGVENAELNAAGARAATAVGKALADPRGRWLLGPQRDSRNEYPITMIMGGVRRRFVVDRTFTTPDGTRWIIDYKATGHEGAGLEEFLDRERERYRAQLEAYARALAPGEAMLGLYFPVLAAWKQWRFDAG
jgi:hypothetical protein